MTTTHRELDVQTITASAQEATTPLPRTHGVGNPQYVSAMRVDHAATSVARRAIAAGLSLVLAMGMFGCGSKAATTTETTRDAAASTTISTASAEINYLNTSDMFTKRDSDASYDASTATLIKLADGATTVSGTGATIEGDTVTITDAGTYVMSGSIGNGQLIVAAPDDAKVQLVLDGVSITSSDSAALLVSSADKVFVTLPANRDNTLATSAAYAASDEGIDGTIFAKDDLIFNGGGKLTVSSAEGHGIVGNDDVKLCLDSSGKLMVTAAKSALNANDSVRSTGDGTYVFSAGTDGVHVGSETSATASDSSNDATADTDAASDNTNTTSRSEASSYANDKGYIYIAGGSFEIEAKSDGFDASGIMQVDGGTITVAADDDGLHAEADLVVTNGTVDVTKSLEGLEGARIGIDGGNVRATASDDGFNATGDDNSNSTGDVNYGFTDGASSGNATSTTAPDGEMPPRMEPPASENGEYLAPPSDSAMGSDESAMSGSRPTPPSDDMAAGRPVPPNRTGNTGSDISGDASSTSSESSTDNATSRSGEKTQHMQDLSSDGTASSDSMAYGRGGGKMGGNGGGMGGGMFESDASALIKITGGTVYVDANGDGIDSNGSIVISGGDVQVDGPVNTGNGAIDCGTEIVITGGSLRATSGGGMEENAGSSTTQPTFLVSLPTNSTGNVRVTDASGNEIASWTSAKQFNAVLLSSDKLTVGESYTVSCGDVSQTVALDSTVTGAGTAMGARGMGQDAGKMRGGTRTEGSEGSEAVTDGSASNRGMRTPRGNGGQFDRQTTTSTTGGQELSSERVTA